MVFTEQFLFFIWQFRLFDFKGLSCVGGELLEVVSPGLLNQNAGPDFSKAKLLIDGTLWVGNVEIHLRSSDWYLHHHQKDAAFESVILHVVYEHDREICRKDGSLIPVLVLKERFPAGLLARYQLLLNEKQAFPCANQLQIVDPIIVESTLSRLIAERFEDKSNEILHRLDLLKGNWDETFYFFIARAFGFNVNAQPFEMLATSLPQQIMAKHKNSQFQIEALTFGQSGLLRSDFTDTYPRALFAEYTFLRKKYRLQEINAEAWKFMRMRPQNFPTIRLAQFASLMANSSHLFSTILELEELPDVCRLFENLPVNPYWKQHYHFNKATKQVSLQLGRSSIHGIVINTICQLLFSYGRYTGNAMLSDRAFSFLTSLAPEHNTIIAQYVRSGLKPENAMMSQAILQLNKYYCNQKKCLNCGVGVKILNR